MALLRALLELRGELGVVLSVAHFDHEIRGDASQIDAEFVRGFAEEYGLEFHLARGDTRVRAIEQKETLEEAARELRYGFFRSLLKADAAHKIATAHTMNDQAETVLFRTIRGAGTRGLGAIHAQRDHIVRPMLDVPRQEIVTYLESLKQGWREDLTNANLAHMRNRIRHELLPILERDYNPGIVETLARAAEIAQAEESYWQSEAARLLPFVSSPGRPVRGGGRAVSTGTGEKSLALHIDALRKQPLALQRHLVRMVAEKLGITANAAHVENVLELAAGNGKGCELPGGWSVHRSFRELQFGRCKVQEGSVDYAYLVVAPGEVAIPEAGGTLRATVTKDPERYNPATPAPLVLQSSETLQVRNWRAGDRYHPANARSEKKVKELLQEMRVSQRERSAWPVVTAGERLLWVKGVRQRTVLVARDEASWAVEFEFLESGA